MKVEQTTTQANPVSLKISLEMGEWERALDKAAEKIAAEAKIAGFRPGKAPRTIVMNQVGEARVISAAIEAAVEEFYPKAAKELAIRPVAFPKVSVDQASPDSPLIFTAEVVVMPEATLGDYRGIRVPKTVPSVPDEEVDKILESMRKRAAEFTEVEREAKTGDWAEIDFEGTLAGQSFEGGSSKNHPLILGDKLFVPGFEEGLVGMRAGEEKEIQVTFPNDYHNSELAGKQVSFKVKLHKVKAVNYPDVDDAFAKKSGQFQTLAELKDDIKRFLVTEADKKATEAVREQAILELVKRTKVEVPDALVEQELEAMVHDLKHQVANAKMEFEDYLKRAGTNEAGLRNEWRDKARERVMAGLALEAFRRAEGIEADDAAVDAEIAKLKAQYPQETDKVESEYAKGPARERLRNWLASQKAVERLVEIATD